MEKWQQDYKAEYFRTTGGWVEFEYRHGGWWQLYFKHYSIKKRKSEVERMTEVLKSRETHNNSLVSDGQTAGRRTA